MMYLMVARHRTNETTLISLSQWSAVSFGEQSKTFHLKRLLIFIRHIPRLPLLYISKHHHRCSNCTYHHQQCSSFLRQMFLSQASFDFFFLYIILLCSAKKFKKKHILHYFYALNSSSFISCSLESRNNFDAL